ncbi:UDP-3-O-(3-hydroxymyristoyl)glucosamine N-acyltransferase [Terriglobus roseus]|uniref:UDP-3-O-acylglucosamine N-acyltransferase n=1 Tax=Terriglobus roseus TaxID=392734 RepID=A0A1H4ITL7_9BACT|nr:UDP-3-O-(3-hydroxymyristoyl)glucosamine N-acyltransferase [Terriglobus roseus]SEB37399.1 UDP-3-O-[3-hydroxymyristoyl] glucosamine N-acyltransferase [Terriglobus roseus]
MKLSEIASRLGAELVGDGDVEITGVAGIEHARPDQVTFIANPKYAPLAKSTRAAAILVEPDFPTLEGTSTLRIRNCYRAFAETIKIFYTAPKYVPGIHPTAVIDPSARIGPGAHVGAYVVVGAGVVMGDDAILLPHAVIYQGARIGHRFFAHAHAVVREFCRIGDDVTLQNGAVIGADGFGYARDGAAWVKIVQSGATVLGDRVEVQANACVDRASIGETSIGAGSKIDNLVQVGHGSTVGENTLLCAQVGLAGSTEVGDRVILAGQVGVAGHCKVGDGAVATAQSGIPSDVAAGAIVSGYPAMDNRQWLRSVAAFARLPEMLREIRSLRKTNTAPE